MGTFEFNELSDNDSNAAITDYTLLSTSFSVKDSKGTIIYTATISTPANAKGKFENNHGSHDKLEFKDEGTVSSSTGPTLPTNTAFEEIKIKPQDDDAAVWGTTNILDVASIFASLDFSLFEKNEFKLKFKGSSGAKDIKFEGALTSISVSSQSTNSKGNTSLSLAAVPETSTFFLMGLGFAGLGFVRRRRLNA